MKKRILIVDDDPLIGNLLRITLEMGGYEAVLAPNGKEALQIMGQQPFGLVITDIFMPEKDGLETVAHLKRNYAGVPIIAISGGGRSFAPEFFLDLSGKLGAVRTFKKPFERQEVLEAVRELLGDKLLGVQ